MNKPDDITRKNEAIWDSRARTYDRSLGFLRWSQRRLVSLLDLRNNPCFLDLACGTGWAVRYAADAAHGRGEFYGIDIAEKMIEQAQANLADYKNAHFCKANGEELPFDDDFFDYIICSNAFHHFSHPEQVVKEAGRVLKPHGKLYVLDATADNFFTRLLDRLSKRLEPGHVKMYSTREYRIFFQKAGLAYIDRRSILWAVKIHIGEKPP